MKKNNEILDRIHATRVKIQNKTKGMSPEECAAYHNKEGLRIVKKFGLEHLLCDSPAGQKSQRV